MLAAAPAIARFTDRRGHDRRRNVSGYCGTAKYPLVSDRRGDMGAHAGAQPWEEVLVQALIGLGGGAAEVVGHAPARSSVPESAFAREGGPA